MDIEKIQQLRHIAISIAKTSHREGITQEEADIAINIATVIAEASDELMTHYVTSQLSIIH